MFNVWHASTSSIVAKRDGWVEKLVVGQQAVVTMEQHHFFADVSRLDPPPPCIILPNSLAAHPSGRMVLCRMSDAGMPLHLVLQQLPYLRSPKAAIDGPRELLRWWRLKHFSSSQLQKAVEYTQRKVLLLVEMLQQLIPGLQWLARQGLSHHDLKPDNIGYDPAGRRFVLWDFGLASRFGQEPVGACYQYAAPEYTVARHLLQLHMSGSFPLSPPELQQLQGLLAGSSHQTYDIFSMGHILYQMTTGVWTYANVDWCDGDSHACDSRQLLDMRPLGWQLAPEAWKALLLDMLEPDPVKRPQTWSNVLHRLDQVVVEIQTAHSSSSSMPLSPVWPGVDKVPRGAIWRLPCNLQAASLDRLRQRHLDKVRSSRGGVREEYHHKWAKAMRAGQTGDAQIWGAMEQLLQSDGPAAWDRTCAAHGLCLPSIASLQPHRPSRAAAAAEEQPSTSLLRCSWEGNGHTTAAAGPSRVTSAAAAGAAVWRDWAYAAQAPAATTARGGGGSRGDSGASSWPRWTVSQQSGGASSPLIASSSFGGSSASSMAHTADTASTVSTDYTGPDLAHGNRHWEEGKQRRWGCCWHPCGA